ncbi:MAG: hypothetical protein ACREEB_15795 [Caulobacteraceae bacterium]
MSRVQAFIAGACLLAAAAPAAAQRLHVNDAAYVGIARCQGLVNSPDLHPRVDPTGINRFMDLESAGRSGNVLDRGRDAKNLAAHDAAVAGPDEKARLLAERDGPCRRWAHMGARAPGGALTGG